MTSSEQKATINERFRQLLKALNHSANSFARLVGVNPSQIVKVVGGQTKPSADTLEKISQAIPRINLNWLIGGHGEMLKPYATAPADESGTTAYTLPQPGTVQEEAPRYGKLADCQRELAQWQERARLFEALAADRQLIIELLRKQAGE